jgi:DNA-binding FrmR family transcriptional regulator
MRDHAEDARAHLTRLRRIEGQVRGIAKMTDKGEDDVAVLTQIAAANRALQAVGLGLVHAHLTNCVNEAVAGGGHVPDEKVTEISAAIARLAKSQHTATVAHDVIVTGPFVFDTVVIALPPRELLVPAPVASPSWSRAYLRLVLSRSRRAAIWATTNHDRPPQLDDGRRGEIF